MLSKIRVLAVFAMLASGMAFAGSAAAQSDDGTKPVTVQSPPPRPAVTPPAAITTRPVPPKPVIDELPPGTSDQILHLKLGEGSSARAANGRLESADRSDAAVNAALAAFPGATIEPMFTRPESELAAEKIRIEARSRRPQADKNLWFRVTLPTGADAVAAVNALNALDVVENAYAEPLPVSPPVTPNYEPLQGYRDPAPIGVDADLLASIPGGLGDNVTIIDIEQGWNLNHEDLGIPASAQLANGTSCSNHEDHGTAVLGELVAVDNGFGVTGIVPNAGIGVVHHYTNLGSGCGNRIAQAIDAAHAVLEAGDVILLEAQTFGPDLTCTNAAGDDNGLIAVEWISAWYDAIVSATSDGIIVVEAGGNGSCNFDNAVYGSPFPAGRPDSGAIIVGAAASPAGSSPARSRLAFSAHGSRVNLQGWGQHVATAGYGLLQGGGPDDQWYTGCPALPCGPYDGFSGTSSASPIVTGAAAALSSIAQEFGSLLTPAQIRSHLIATGTAQDTTSPGALSGNIGPMPDLEAALASIPLCPQDDVLEDDDTRATATPLVRGVATRAVVCDEDWFSLPVTAGIDVTVDVEFTDAFGDVDIHLYDPSGTQVDTSTSTSDIESITHTALMSGDYAVKVFGYLGAENIYSVTMSKSICPPDDTMEPNESLGAATPLASGVTQAAIACDAPGPYFNIDWYSLPVQAGQTIDATIEFIDAGGDLTAILYDPSGSTQLDAGVSTTDNETLSYVATATGDYGLLVFGAANEENVYDVTMSATCTDDGFEPNDTLETATPLVNGVAVDAHVCAGNSDWYSIPVISGQLVTAVVDFVNADGDLDIELRRADGGLVAAEDRETDGEAITWTAAQTGTYTLRVYGYFSSATNDYSVSLKAAAHPLIRAFGAVVNPEGDTGSQIVDLTLFLEDEFGQPYSSPTPVTASWSTVAILSNPLVARPFEDYYAVTNGLVTFEPGESITSVPVEVLGDTIDEPPLLYGEWGVWRATNPSSNAKINTAAFFGLGLFIIIDDD